MGSVVISLGFLTDQNYVESPEISNQYEKLQAYKDELEKINQNHLQLLQDLEERIKNSDDVHLTQIREEIAVIKQVIDENRAELEDVISKLSQMESTP